MQNVIATKATILFSALSYNLALIGNYTVTISYPMNLSPNNVNIINIELVDPCKKAVVPPATIQNQNVYALDPTSFVDITPSIDSKYMQSCSISLSLTV